MRKRVLSLILALVLCVGVLPVAVSAAETTDNDRARIARLPENPGKPVLIDPEAAGFMLWDLPESKEEVFAQVEELTHQLISGKSTETEQAKAIFDWVSQNITINNPGRSENGLTTFYKKSGTTGNCARLVKLMYVIAEMPVIYATGKRHGTSTNHVWNAVFADGRWIFLDAALDLWDIDPMYHNNLTSLGLTADFICDIRPDRVEVKGSQGYKIPKVLVYPSYADWVNGAIGNCPELETIVVPKNIKVMGSPAFSCENLKSIIFEDGNDCEISSDFSLFPITSVKLPEGVTEAGGYLQGCTYLTDVVIPSTVKKINSFKGCTSLRSLTLPDGVEEISSSAFTNCTSLTDINIPYGVKEIQYATFCNCSSLESITLPSSVTKISVMAFAGCKSLESITLPSSVTKISETAFASCESLESVYIPSSVTDIADDAFFLSPNVVIYTEPGSYAESYAKQNNIKVVTSGAPTPTPTPADSTTPSAWAQPEVSEATQAGLVPSDLLSSYTSAITREDFCRLMVKLIEAESGKDIASYVASQSKEISAPFTDTSAQEVKAAYALGIVNGVSATKFNPTGSITRQEAAAMLERTAKLLGLSSGSGISFTDSGKIASWASGSVAFVSGLTDPTTGGAVMGGVGNGNFGPTGTYTREQAIAFPIPTEQYDNVLGLLDALKIGDMVEQDCRVDALDGSYPILKRLEGSSVNIDELDYLAKRLESFCDGENAKFQGAAVKLGISSIRDFINLTFCCQEATVITDFSSLEKIGKGHLMTVNGGCMPPAPADGRRTALDLICNHDGYVTPYGVVYDNGMKLEQLYDGRHFPSYYYEPPVLAFEAISDEGGLTGLLSLPMSERQLTRLMQRAEFERPDVHLTVSVDALPEAVSDTLDLERLASEDLADLNRLCMAVEFFNGYGMAKLNAAMLLTGASEIDSLCRLAENIDKFDFVPHVHTAEEYGRYMIQENGVMHCLLALGKDSNDGVLIEFEGYGYARYAAYIPGMRDIVKAEMSRAAEFIVQQGTERSHDGSWRVRLEDLAGLNIQEGNGLDSMLCAALKSRPEVAAVDMHDGCIEMEYHPEYCQQLNEYKSPGLRVKDLLPLLKGNGLMFLCHEEAEQSVLVENLRLLTDAGQEDHAALLNATVSELCETSEGMEIVLTGVEPEELVRFNEAFDAFMDAEQAMGPTM